MIDLLPSVSPPLLGLPDEKVEKHSDGLRFYRCRLGGYRVVVYKVNQSKHHRWRVELFEGDEFSSWGSLYATARPDQLHYVDDDPVALLAALYALTSEGNYDEARR